MNIKIIIAAIILLLIGGVVFNMLTGSEQIRPEADEIVNQEEAPEFSRTSADLDEGVLTDGQVMYVAFNGEVPSDFCNSEENYFNCLRGSSEGRPEPKEYLTDAQNLNFLEPCSPQPGKDFSTTEVVKCDGFYQEDFLFDSDGTDIIRNTEEVVVYNCDFLVSNIDFIPRVDSFEPNYLRVTIQDPICTTFQVYNAS